jgi:hypothetical protein
MADGGGWVGKYGVPSLIISVAAFAFQQQQQTFDRLQTNVQSGYLFYSSNRTPLRYSDDVERELSLVRIVGRAFPNIYCDVRADLYHRAYEAEDRTGLDGETGRRPIDTADINNLQNVIASPALSMPPYAPFPENLGEAWLPPYGKDAIKECPALNERVAPEEIAAAETPVVATEAPTPAPPPPEATTAPAEEAPSSSMSASVDAERSVASAPSAAPTRRGRMNQPDVASAPALTPAPSLMRVFFHIPLGGPRVISDPRIVAARAELAPYNYRVMRGVERVAQGRFPARAEVRFFGPAERDAAQALANYLTYQFRDEGLVFRINAIGESFPNSPHENLEVWIPDTGG